VHDFLVAASGDILQIARQIRSPATVSTNLLLAAQCGAHARRVATGPAGPIGEGRAWCRFFAFVGGATLLGALKHGTPGLLDPTPHTAIAWASNLALGAGIAVLHGILVPGRSATAWVAWWLVYVGAATVSAVTGSFAATGLAAAAGLLPAVGRGVRDAARGRPGGRELATGWATAAIAGVAWVAGPVPADWFGRVDVAHLVLMVALGFVLLGAERRIRRARLRARPN
jgi:hypothetical protein